MAQPVYFKLACIHDNGQPFLSRGPGRALAKYGSPDILNTDQGSQFTCQEWIESLLKANVQISMDGKGRFLDNIFVERVWRTVKYEDIYLKRYETVRDLKSGLAEYIDFYNNRRIHQALDYKTPAQVYGVEKPFKSLRLTPPTFKQLSYTKDDDISRKDQLRA